ncbi:MAG: hypothetical protein WAT79_14215 [Saprospiraceae bacterium]
MRFRIIVFSIWSILLVSCKSNVVQTFHENGKLKEEYTLNNKNEKNGTYKSYSDEENLYELAEYKNGLLVGKRILYHPNGKTEVIEQYNEEGKLHGVYQVFYDNGQLMTDKNYINNELEGEVRVYYKTGKLKEVVQFKDSQENGAFVEYFPNGQIQWKGTYLNGDNEFGDLEEYDSTGILIKKMICDSSAICRSTWKIENYDEKYKN